MKVLFRSFLTASGLLAFASAALASTLGNDNASNYGSWTSGSNAGTGFGAWSFANGDNGGFSGFFLGDSTSLGGSGSNSGGANINVSNKSFGMYANQNASAFANANRSFAGGALTAGQNFSCDVAVNFRNGAKGIDIKGADGSTIFTFDVTGDNYTVLSAATTNNNLSSAYSANSAFHLEFAQTSSTSGNWTITRSGGVTDAASGTYTGDAAGFGLFISGTDGGDQNNIFSNNFSVTSVPEPATWLAGCLLVGVVGCRVSRLRGRGVPISG